MALFAMLAPTVVLGSCPANPVASVSCSEGVSPLYGSHTESFPWLRKVGGAGAMVPPATVDEAAKLARALGLELGGSNNGQNLAFASAAYAVKGMYAYNSGSPAYEGHAYFGIGGTPSQHTQTPSWPPAYRPWDLDDPRMPAEIGGRAAGLLPWSTNRFELMPPAGSEDWLKCAEWYRLGTDRQVNAGEVVTIECESEVCDVYAFLYHEPPRSSASNGGLPGTLTDGNEWTPASCAPKFLNPVGGGSEECRMTAFKRMLYQGQTAEIAIDAVQPAQYLVVAVAPGVDCGSNILLNDQSACEATEPGRAKNCEWDGNQCADNWCKRTPSSASPGPSPPSGPALGPPSGPTPDAGTCTAPLDEIRIAQVRVFSTGLDANGLPLAEGATDPHWEVQYINGNWMDAVYGKTSKQNGVPVDWPPAPGGVTQASRPAAHPWYWFDPNDASRTANLGGGIHFLWRQFFDVPAGASFSFDYRVGYDDVSYGAPSVPNGPLSYEVGDCKHTVWVNNVPQSMPAIRASPEAQNTQYTTGCVGTLSGPWLPGQNKIEFRIRNQQAFYGFRFVSLQPI